MKKDTYIRSQRFSHISAFDNGHVDPPGGDTVTRSVDFFDLAFQLVVEVVLNRVANVQDQGIIVVKVDGFIGVYVPRLDMQLAIGGVDFQDIDIGLEGGSFLQQALTTQIELAARRQFDADKDRW